MKTEKTDKRTSILDSAEILFSELGFEGTSTRQIAKEAGANMAMINYYFGSKEGVFIEIMGERIASFKSLLDQISESSSPANEQILTVVEIYAKRIFNNIPFHKMMHRELSLCQRPEMFGKIKDAMNNNLKAIEVILENGIRSGNFRKIDVRLFISTIIGTISNTALSASKVLGTVTDLNDTKTREALEARLITHLKDLVTEYLIIKK